MCAGGVQGLLPVQALRAAAGVAQQPGHMCDEGLLPQGHQGAVCVPLPGIYISTCPVL